MDRGSGFGPIRLTAGGGSARTGAIAAISTSTGTSMVVGVTAGGIGGGGAKVGSGMIFAGGIAGAA